MDDCISFPEIFLQLLQVGVTKLCSTHTALEVLDYMEVPFGVSWEYP